MSKDETKAEKKKAKPQKIKVRRGEREAYLCIQRKAARVIKSCGIDAFRAFVKHQSVRATDVTRLEAKYMRRQHQAYLNRDAIALRYNLANKARRKARIARKAKLAKDTANSIKD